MSLENLSRTLEQAGFLSAVLAGFSITLYATLVAGSRQDRATDRAAACALFAALCLALSSFTSVSGVVESLLDRDPADARSGVVGAFLWTSFSFLGGMVFLLASLGASGWIRSRRMGILSTAAVLATFLAIVWFLVRVVGAF